MLIKRLLLLLLLLYFFKSANNCRLAVSEERVHPVVVEIVDVDQDHHEGK